MSKDDELASMLCAINKSGCNYIGCSGIDRDVVYIRNCDSTKPMLASDKYAMDVRIREIFGESCKVEFLEYNGN